MTAIPWAFFKQGAILSPGALMHRCFNTVYLPSEEAVFVKVGSGPYNPFVLTFYPYGPNQSGDQFYFARGAYSRGLGITLKGPNIEDLDLVRWSEDRGLVLATRYHYDLFFMTPMWFFDQSWILRDMFYQFVAMRGVVSDRLDSNDGLYPTGQQERDFIASHDTARYYHASSDYAILPFTTVSSLKVQPDIPVPDGSLTRQSADFAIYHHSKGVLDVIASQSHVGTPISFGWTLNFPTTSQINWNIGSPQPDDKGSISVDGLQWQFSVVREARPIELAKPYVTV